MLLYSTTLQMKDSLTKDGFIQLVLEWNQTSSYAVNVIPNINWNGERNIRFGNDFLWLDIEEYRNENIIAIRYQKQVQDGAVWDTDYVMNYNTMEMTIQLNREYTEGALMEDLQFSTPHFVSMLIDGGYLRDDHGLPVLRTSIDISEKNVDLLADVINGKAHYRLPVVYISKTIDNQNPVNISWLCSKLKGAAYVLLQVDKHSNGRIRSACRDHNEYAGGIGIYFPNGKHRRFLYRRNSQDGDGILLDRVTRSVLQYMNAQKKPILSTWFGVQNALLRDRYLSQKAERAEAERAKEAAQNEVEYYIDAFDEDIEKLRQQNEELSRANISLQMENQGLRAKMSDTEDVPVLFFGTEGEFYQGEIKEIILDAIAEKRNNLIPRTRRWDVLNDILLNNKHKNIRDQRESIVKEMFKDYKSLSGVMKQKLSELGLEVTEEGKHYRLTYYGDERYKTTIAKTGSDHREGRNIASVILKTMM